MEQLLKKMLLPKLKAFKGANLHGLDEESFISGYANGFVNGFLLIQNWIIGIVILLVISLIFNLFYLVNFIFVF
jgi:hypothetical protein